MSSTTNHNFVIPGFDRSYCQRCRKWICSTAELERLKKALGKKDKDGDRRSTWGYLVFDFCGDSDLGLIRLGYVVEPVSLAESVKQQLLKH